MQRTTKRGKGDNPLLHALLCFLVAFEMFPLVVLLLNTLRTDAEIKNSPIALPTRLVFENYVETWRRGGYAIAYRNSLFIALITIVIVVSLTGLAAYSMVKLKPKYGGFFVGYYMLALALPGFLYIVPDYYMLNMMGLINTHMGIIIIYVAMHMPFNILLLRTYLIGIPIEFEEAARIDGCGEMSVIRHITIPLAKPILTTVALLVFYGVMNEFLWSNTFLTNDNLRTVATRFYKFTAEYSIDLAKVFTAGMISLAPILILYLFLQK